MTAACAGFAAKTYDCDDNCGSGVTNLCDKEECPEDKCEYEDKVEYNIKIPVGVV